MLKYRLLCASLILSGLLGAAAPAEAIVRGTVARDPVGVRGSVVRVENDRGELCSGVLITPDVVLTAAHCVIEEANYSIFAVDRAFRTQRVRAVARILHPSFKAGTTPRTQPGIDLAVMKLERGLGRDFRPLELRRARGVLAGEAVKIAGFGTTDYQRKRTARTLREANLVALGEVRIENTVLMTADLERLAERSGAGACQGDSGGPILVRSPSGYELAGIISWSSGALAETRTTACGGLTAVTPVASHAGWIASRVAELDRIVVAEPAAPAPAPAPAVRRAAPAAPRIVAPLPAIPPGSPGDWVVPGR